MKDANLKTYLLFSALAPLTASLIHQDSWPQVVGLGIVALVLIAHILAARIGESESQTLRQLIERNRETQTREIAALKDKMDAILIKGLGGGF